jgi:hypothetical protein
MDIASITSLITSGLSALPTLGSLSTFSKFMTAGFALTVFLSVYTLWLFFLASMVLIAARKKGTLSKPALVLGIPVIGLGLLIDVSVNVMLTAVFMEATKEWTVSQRLSRYKAEASGWRYKIAKFICENFLDTFDPSGCHCK